MKTLLTLAALRLLIPISAAQDKDAKPCDLKTIEKAKYCAKCDQIDPKVDDKGLCDGQKVTEVDVCVKTCYACTGCKKKSPVDEACCKGCVKEKTVVKSRVVFQCEGCGALGEKEGDCAKDECAKAGKKIKKTCAKSGECPHIGE